jgi:alpha-1,3-rhamnosyl/mannosyltransferase
VWRETRLPAALRRDAVSVLHSPVAAIPLLTRVPRLATVHELPWLAHPGIEGRAREAVHRVRIRAAVRAAARVVVPSRTVARDLVVLCPRAEGRIVVLPFGIEPRFRTLDRGAWERRLRRRLGIPDGPVLLFVGKARRRKNLPALIDALPRLPGPVSLVLAGVSPHELPRIPGVVTPGFVSDEDLVGLYNLATALVYPSLSEGFGFPPLEAMACGIPVVATTAGAVPEVLEDAALLVDPTSPDSLRSAIERVLLDHDLRRRLSERGRRHSARFCWRKTAERALGLMASVAA